MIFILYIKTYSKNIEKKISMTELIRKLARDFINK